MTSKQLALLAALALAHLPACERPAKEAAPDTGRSTGAKLDPLPGSGPPIAALEAHGALKFSGEDDGNVHTSACLSLDEIPPQAGYGGVEPVFIALMKAFEAQDGKAYDAITVVEQSSTGTKCPHTMKELFQQADAVTPVRIDHVYAFDDLVLVDAVLRRPEREFTYAFEFERGLDGKIRFAPCSDRTPFHTAVRSWLNDPRAGDEFSPRCPAEVVERATHRVPLGPEPARAGALLLRGAPITAPGDLRETADRVTTAIKAIERAAAANDITALQQHMAKEAGAKLAASLSAASAQERESYARHVSGVEPFFVFDASPLVIAYVRQGGSTRVLYFLPAADGRLVWTNSNLNTYADDLFKRGPLRESASLPDPFGKYEIR